MSRKYRTISVDEYGRSEIVTINGDDGPAGSFGDGLSKYDDVVLADGSAWVVDQIYTHIQTGGSGASNYICVDLVRG